jgi:hypothetical protein
MAKEEEEKEEEKKAPRVAVKPAKGEIKTTGEKFGERYTPQGKRTAQSKQKESFKEMREKAAKEAAEYQKKKSKKTVAPKKDD